MAAIKRRRGLPAALAARFPRLLGLLGGLLASGSARAAQLPEDRADLMYHYYAGGGVRADGPALLVRKNLLDKVSLTGTYYVDAVSNASIDVVTTASPYKETRREKGVGLDYVVRDATITLSYTDSDEPDYRARGASLDVAQETFGGMTTVALGFTRGSDKVGQRGTPGFFDRATHWRYRLGVTQVLTPRWLVAVNAEAVSDDGFLGSPYRAARVFGAAVPERVPRTRTSRALLLRAVGDLGTRQVVRVQYRYFWDTWDIRSHTLELGHSRYFGERWLADGYLRYYTQNRALFYADNATAETLYVSRNRQLATYKSFGIGAKASYAWRRVPGQYEIRLNGALERARFNFSDFTDLRSGRLYSYDATVMQLFVSATF
ncbi:MAG: DUF3570 domain-containing protein [Sutterellaceae bacterium]|nr:DUF3570 domain-containing protein [Burkholderiaceae bacterium]MDW8428958.1 DUF3570 domain-containing protein [Sutterellaceae bacterium]